MLQHVTLKLLTPELDFCGVAEDCLQIVLFFPSQLQASSSLFSPLQKARNTQVQYRGKRAKTIMYLPV